MAKDGGWSLPANINPARQCITLEIPKDRYHMAAFAGALQELTKWWNWQRDPDHRAIAAAMVWQDVISGLGSVLNYSDPEISEACDMPLNLRITEDCQLEYTNDGGLTWLPVAGWNNAAECFIGPPGPQGEPGAPGEPGEPGEPGVIGVQLVRVDGDTPPDMTYDQNTQIITATMQEQWFRGIRAVSLPEIPVDYIAPHAIDLQTYDNPTEWTRLAIIPAHGTPYVPPPPATTPLTDHEKKCLASKNAAEVLVRTYTDIGNQLTSQLFADPIEMLEALAESLLGVLTKDMGWSFFTEAASILSFMALQGEYAGNPWDVNDTPALEAQLYDLATVTPGGGVTFDREAFLTWLNAQWTATVPFDHPWGLMMDVVRFTGPEALDRAGAVAFYTDPSACWDTSGPWHYLYLNGQELPPEATVIQGTFNPGNGVEATGPGGIVEVEWNIAVPIAGPVSQVAAVLMSFTPASGGWWPRTYTVEHKDGIWSDDGYPSAPPYQQAVSYPMYPDPDLYGVRRFHFKITMPADRGNTSIRVSRLSILNDG